MNSDISDTPHGGIDPSVFYASSPDAPSFGGYGAPSVYPEEQAGFGAMGPSLAMPAALPLHYDFGAPLAGNELNASGWGSYVNESSETPEPPLQLPLPQSSNSVPMLDTGNPSAVNGNYNSSVEQGNRPDSNHSSGGFTTPAEVADDGDADEDGTGEGNKSAKNKWQVMHLLELVRAANEMDIFGAKHGTKAKKWDELRCSLAKQGVKHSVKVLQNKLEDLLTYHTDPELAKPMIVQIMKSETTNSLFAAPLDALTSSRQRYKNMSDEEKEKAAKKLSEDKEGGEAIRQASLGRMKRTKDKNSAKSEGSKKSKPVLKTAPRAHSVKAQPLATKTINTTSVSSTSGTSRASAEASDTPSYPSSSPSATRSSSPTTSSGKENIPSSVKPSKTAGTKRKFNFLELNDEISSDDELPRLPPPKKEPRTMENYAEYLKEELDGEREYRAEILDMLNEGKQHNDKMLDLQERALSSNEKFQKDFLSLLAAKL